MNEIWQTTNQEPWVSALVNGDILFKTRTSRPVVPVGAKLLLHASTKIWPAWEHFTNRTMQRYASLIPQLRKETCGKIIGVGTVSLVCPTSRLPRSWSVKPWDVTWGNCAAPWAWTCEAIVRLETPVKARGFQAPFCRAKQETIDLVRELNPGVI